MELKIPDEVINSIWKAIANTPELIALGVFSLFSGNLWLFIIYSFFIEGKKNIEMLDSKLGRIALGGAWFFFIFLLVYWIRNGVDAIDYSKSLPLAITVITLGLFTQFLIFAGFCMFRSVK